MTELSTAAQAVINSAIEAGNKYGYATPVLYARIAASLRTTASQLYKIKWKGRIDPDPLLDIGIAWTCDALLALAKEMTDASIRYSQITNDGITHPL